MNKKRGAFKRIALVLAGGALAVGGLTACDDDATVVSENLSRSADNFEIERRVVFYNGITGEYLLEVVGLCSVSSGGTLSVTCKTGDEAYKKHFLGLSDNVTWFAEQLEAADVSAYYYRVTFKPQTILPDVDARFEGELPANQD